MMTDAKVTVNHFERSKYFTSSPIPKEAPIVMRATKTITNHDGNIIVVTSDIKKMP
ncbi:MAG TPA: hypothetical protein VHC48_16990 [Puia sp.]|nr:hypothetical protein [Puia sp.]